MPLKTTAFAAAQARGWSMQELATRAGVPIMTLYSVRQGHRAPGPKVIEGIMRAFPDLPFERLFVSAESANADRLRANAEPAQEAA